MMGRRFGMKSGTNPFKKETDVDKIKKTFGPKKFKNLKPVDPKKQKGLSKLPRAVRNKMGYMKSGGRSIMAGKGLYANIHAKRKRGGKMRKKGAKGAPTAANFARAKQTARKR